MRYNCSKVPDDTKQPEDTIVRHTGSEVYWNTCSRILIVRTKAKPAALEQFPLVWLPCQYHIPHLPANKNKPYHISQPIQINHSRSTNNCPCDRWSDKNIIRRELIRMMGRNRNKICNKSSSDRIGGESNRSSSSWFTCIWGTTRNNALLAIVQLRSSTTVTD